MDENVTRDVEWPFMSVQMLASGFERDLSIYTQKLSTKFFIGVEEKPIKLGRQRVKL